MQNGQRTARGYCALKRGLTIAATLGAVALTVVLATVVARTLDPVLAFLIVGAFLLVGTVLANKS